MPLELVRDAAADRGGTTELCGELIGSSRGQGWSLSKGTALKTQRPSLAKPVTVKGPGSQILDVNSLAGKTNQC